uniref:F-box domain-containing protein n=1 Tax=Panagrolaimus sp. JU765 TaxID=591449 RepID=A0AC34QX12_9BILA
MLLDLPILCQLEILKRLPPTSIDNVALVSRHFASLIKKCRKELPKPKVFLTVTQELDEKTVTLCLYLHPIHYNGNMEQCMKRKVYKQMKFPLQDLPTLQLEKHFGFFKLESILLTTRFMELLPVTTDLVLFTNNLFQKYSKNIRYFAAKNLNFKNEVLTTFLTLFETFEYSLDVLKEKQETLMKYAAQWMT